MSTCPSCHQAIPFSCDRDDCHAQIIIIGDLALSYQNHHKECGNKKKVAVRVGKPSIVTTKEQASFAALVAEAMKRDG